MALNIMVVESEPHGAAEATRQLRNAGHTVLTCHEPGSPAFPCRGVENASECPLRSHDVDVALAVRTQTLARPTVSEDGARCALVQRVPLVVSGAHVLDPFDDYASRTIDYPDDVVEACERTADAPIERLSRRATAVLREVLGSTDPQPEPCAEVRRRSGRLDVHILQGQDLTRSERSRAAIRIAMALRELDPFAAGIDVAVDCT